MLLSLWLLGGGAAAGEPATGRYAPAQLRVGQDLLERARSAAERGEAALAGRLAWQASLDARLAWRMTESPALRADAVELRGEAAALIRSLAAAGGG